MLCILLPENVSGVILGTWGFCSKSISAVLPGMLNSSWLVGEAAIWAPFVSGLKRRFHARLVSCAAIALSFWIHVQGWVIHPAQRWLQND
jgi:hypothetical protein